MSYPIVVVVTGVSSGIGRATAEQFAQRKCKVFGTACTPETPIGTCMVSSEGACAAYYNFGRLHREAAVTLGRSR